MIVLVSALAGALTALPDARGGTSPQQAPVILRFHPQTTDRGGEFSRPVTLQHSGKQVFIGTMPLINERDVVSAHPFPAGDGTFGAYFKLDAHGTNLVMQHTTSQRGTFLFAYFNGRQVIDLYVDRPVTDGIITIPRGLAAAEVELIEGKYPPIGQEGRKPVKKKPAPNPTATQ